MVTDFVEQNLNTQNTCSFNFSKLGMHYFQGHILYLEKCSENVVLRVGHGK
jgi:hypothetical protein